MPRNRLVLGDWNAICDNCGFKFKASQLRKDWKNLEVCAACYEPKHPQLMIKVPRDDPAVPWSRPEGEPQFVFRCFPWTHSAYADLAGADCAMADNTEYTYAALVEMKNRYENGV